MIFALLFMYMYYLRMRMLEDTELGTPDQNTLSDASRRYITLVEMVIRNTENPDATQISEDSSATTIDV